MLRDLSAFLAGSRVRVATSALTVLVVMSALLAFTPVGSAASDLLSIFRVKKFVAVTVDPSSMPNLASPADLGTFKVSGDRTPRQVSAAEAERVVGFKVPIVGALPAGIRPSPRSTAVTGTVTSTFVPDIKKVRAYLDSIGATNVKLPDSLDGAPITMSMPPTVVQLYLEEGGQDRAPDGTIRPLAGQKFLYLGATTSPTLTVPDGIDVEQLRDELLKVPGLPPDLANQLRSIDDWRNTVVVPVVKGKSKNVTVQGQQALLIQEENGPGFTLLWLKDSIIYTMTGNVSEAEILAAANSLR